MGVIFIVGLLVWGWAEMSAFIYIGNRIGGLFTLLGVFATAFIGIALIKNQGLLVLNRVRGDMAKGRAPVTSIADSISLVFGGVLMLIPGYVTDAIGVLLFLPVVRTLAGIYLLKCVANNHRFSGFVNLGDGSFPRGDDQQSSVNNKQNPFGFDRQQRPRDNPNDIIEGEFEEQPESKSQLHQKKKGRS